MSSSHLKKTSYAFQSTNLLISLLFVNILCLAQQISFQNNSRFCCLFQQLSDHHPHFLQETVLFRLLQPMARSAHSEFAGWWETQLRIHATLVSHLMACRYKGVVPTGHTLALLHFVHVSINCNYIFLHPCWVGQTTARRAFGLSFKLPPPAQCCPESTCLPLTLKPGKQ